MSDLYTNYATFIASSRTLDIIESCIDTHSGFFDFDKIKPTPSVLNHLTSSPEIIDVDILPTPKGGGFPPSRESFPVS